MSCRECAEDLDFSVVGKLRQAKSRGGGERLFVDEAGNIFVMLPAPSRRWECVYIITAGEDVVS